MFLLAFAVGLVFLYFGAEGTLRGAVGLARSYGISTLVIGLTLVAYGTSAPELSLDITAAIQGNTQLAFGDVVGANIANVGLILGVAAVVSPLDVKMRLLKAEVPIVIAVSLLVWGLAVDGELSRQDGLILLAGFVLLTGYTVQSARREQRSVRRELEQQAENHGHRGKNLGLVLCGLFGLVVGSQFMVYGAVGLARAWGMSELMIGVTIVAIGTTLPELATAVVAARKKEADIVVGNVLGSNIFNLLVVMAVVAVIRPIEIPLSATRFELPIMVGFVLMLVPIMLRHRTVTRTEGGFLIGCFVVFLIWQVIHGTSHRHHSIKPCNTPTMGRSSAHLNASSFPCRPSEFSAMAIRSGNRVFCFSWSFAVHRSGEAELRRRILPPTS